MPRISNDLDKVVALYTEEEKSLETIDISIPGIARFHFVALANKLAEKCVRRYWVTHLRPAFNESVYEVNWWSQ